MCIRGESERRGVREEKKDRQEQACQRVRGGRQHSSRAPRTLGREEGSSRVRVGTPRAQSGSSRARAGGAERRLRFQQGKDIVITEKTGNFRPNFKIPSC